MIEITLLGESKLKSNLDKIRNLNKLVALWMKSGEPNSIMNDSFEKNFASQGRPKWQGLARSTEEDRVAKGFGKSPILTRTGTLRDEITSMKGKVSVTGALAEIRWGIDLLRNNEKGKFSGLTKGKGSYGQSIPKRQMISFQKQDATNLSKSLRNWIFRSIK